MNSPLEDLLHARTGPMTSEMVLRPGDFGLGRVPARLAPAGTTSSVCGFCSTGCSLKIHLNAAGEAINLTEVSGLDGGSSPRWFIPADQLPPPTAPPATPAPSSSESSVPSP